MTRILAGNVQEDADGRALRRVHYRDEVPFVQSLRLKAVSSRSRRSRYSEASEGGFTRACSRSRSPTSRSPDRSAGAVLRASLRLGSPSRGSRACYRNKERRDILTRQAQQTAALRGV
jgi:hypothetical protein